MLVLDSLLDDRTYQRSGFSGLNDGVEGCVEGGVKGCVKGYIVWETGTEFCDESENISVVDNSLSWFVPLAPLVPQILYREVSPKCVGSNGDVQLSNTKSRIFVCL